MRRLLRRPARFLQIRSSGHARPTQHARRIPFQEHDLRPQIPSILGEQIPLDSKNQSEWSAPRKLDDGGNEVRTVSPRRAAKRVRHSPTALRIEQGAGSGGAGKKDWVSEATATYLGPPEFLDAMSVEKT